jgi:hypothetical protein
MTSRAFGNFKIAWLSATVASALALDGCSPPPAVAATPTSPPAAQPAASSSIITLQKMSKVQNVGLGSPGEARRATLSTDPIPVVTIRLDTLKKYDNKQGLSQLDTSPTQVIYPVKVDANVKSSVTVTDVGGDWQPSGYGNVELAKRLTSIRAGEARRANVPESSFFMYSLPALGIDLLAHKEGAETKLTPIDDDPRFGFKAGQTLPADEALRRILPVAHSYNGLPG